MVGPTASVLTPCVPLPGAPSRAARCASRFRRLCGLLLSLAVLLPAAAVAQGPRGPIQQTGYGGHGGHGGHGGVISRHLHPYPMGPRPAPPCPEVTFEYVPPHGERLDQHLAAMGEATRSLWYRLEYLHWNIKDPGTAPLGANRLSGNEEGPFDAVDIVAEGFATQPNAGQFDLDNNNGLRFSLGSTTRVGDFEANVWVLNQSDSLIAIDPIRRFDLLGDPDDNTIPNFFAATILTNSGMLSDTTMLLYDQGYRASLKTEVFGTEANFVFNPFTPNQPLTFRPMLGFQYFNFREGLLIAGGDERNAMDPGDPDATVIYNRRISAKSLNNVYAPQIGLRAEFAHEWFTVGVSPKFLLGFNRRRDQLGTAQLLQLDDRSYEEEHSTEFAPGFDLQVDARVHVNEHFSLFVGYQLYVLSNISRPADNIIYDSLGGTEANLQLRTSKLHQMWFDGLTVGAELRFH